MKRNRSLLILAAVGAIVAALVWWDHRRPSTDERQRERAHVLPSFDRAAATEIELERGGSVTRLRHEASGWWLVGPPRRRADDTAVESLLSVLEFGQVERRIATVDPALAAKLGLDKPRVVVRVAGHTLRIGGDDPSRGVYVARDDEPGALVVERRLVETADLDPRLWPSMRLTLSEPLDAMRITFDGWELARQAGWRVVRPVATRAADAKVDALVQSLTRARATRVVAAPAPGVAEQGSGSALSLDGVAQARLVGDCPGAAQETLVARADGAWLCFRATDLNLVRAPPTTFYQRRLFPLRLDDVTAVDVGPLRLRRESGVWRVTAPIAAVGPARDEAVRAALEPLLAAEARSFAATPVTGGTHLRLATRDDEISATLDGIRARRTGDTVTLELTTSPEVAFDVSRLRAPADLGTTPF